MLLGCEGLRRGGGVREFVGVYPSSCHLCRTARHNAGGIESHRPVLPPFPVGLAPHGDMRSLSDVSHVSIVAGGAPPLRGLQVTLRSLSGYLKLTNT